MTDTYQEVGTGKQWKMWTTCTTSLRIDVLCWSLLIEGVMRFLIFSYKQCVVLGWDALWIYSLRRIHLKPSCLDSVPCEPYSLPIATGTSEDWSPHSGFGSHGYRGSKIPQNKQIFTVGSPTVVKLLNHQLITSPTWSSELWTDSFHLPFQGTAYLYLNWWGATTSGHLCSDIPRHTRVERPEFQGAGGHKWHWSFFWKRWWHLENMIWWNVVDVQDWIVVSNWLRFRSDDFGTIRLCRMNTYSFISIVTAVVLIGAGVLPHTPRGGASRCDIDSMMTGIYDLSFHLGPRYKKRSRLPCPWKFMTGSGYNPSFRIAYDNRTAQSWLLTGKR